MSGPLWAAFRGLSPTDGALALTFGKSADGWLPSPDIGGVEPGWPAGYQRISSIHARDAI